VRVLLLSRYGRRGASSRLRSYQYLPYLRAAGFDIEVCQLLDDSYLEALYFGGLRLPSVIRGYLRRVTKLMFGRRYDLIWIEKEFFPWVPYLLERVVAYRHRKTPLLADYDDAVFQRYEDHSCRVLRSLMKNKIPLTMERASIVVAGSEYLAAYASANGARRVELLPTVVDTQRYVSTAPEKHELLRIGWIGSPKTFKYLASVLPAILESIQGYAAEVVAIGGGMQHELPRSVQIRSWSEDAEVNELQRIDIGIMPIPDEPFERGKCGYKLIQYMASGKPVVASPVGENINIVAHGVTGFLATTSRDWSNAIRTLLNDAGLRKRMGAAGRSLAETKYSLKVAAPRLASLIREAVAG
jgi:glycosyltransferase involved in cell wall biosynthesis